VCVKPKRIEHHCKSSMTEKHTLLEPTTTKPHTATMSQDRSLSREARRSILFGSERNIVTFFNSHERYDTHCDELKRFYKHTKSIHDRIIRKPHCDASGGTKMHLVINPAADQYTFPRTNKTVDTRVCCVSTWLRLFPSDSPRRRSTL